MFDAKNSKRLPNGARIIERRQTGEAWIWLCEFEGSYHPFVTWVSPAFDPGATSCGHYFGEYKTATIDFWERVCYYAKKECEYATDMQKTLARLYCASTC